MMIGDFSRIQALRNEQIDVALGVRSTVYVKKSTDRGVNEPGVDYETFMLEMFAKLRNGGLYLDDNVRENFGRSNRIAEIKQAQENWNKLNPQNKVEIRIIWGPGIKGEDDDRGLVPMAVAVGKNIDHSVLISSMLEEGFELRSLNEEVEERLAA